MSKQISFRDANGRRVSGCFEVSHGIITVIASDGRMKTADIEVGIRSGLFSVPHGIGNLVLRGLTFEYDTTPINGSGKGAVVINSANNVLIDNTKILYNNWVGISLTATNNVTFSYVAADGNGEDGIKGYQVTNWLLNGSETTWNNWRSASGNLFGMDTAGMKVTDVHGLALQNLPHRTTSPPGFGSIPTSRMRLFPVRICPSI